MPGILLEAGLRAKELDRIQRAGLLGAVGRVDSGNAQPSKFQFFRKRRPAARECKQVFAILFRVAGQKAGQLADDIAM